MAGIFTEESERDGLRVRLLKCPRYLHAKEISWICRSAGALPSAPLGALCDASVWDMRVNKRFTKGSNFDSMSAFDLTTISATT
jgi:hypothetical protein